MATIKIVPAEDWEILLKYLDASGIVLIPENALTKFPEKDAERIRNADEEDLESYDFGGDADVWVDVIHGPESYAAMLLSDMLSSKDEAEEEE